MDCENSPLMHKHHIIPRYMGGTDDPTNLVEVTVTQHAMYHFCNYQLWKNIEDYVAYRGLSGQISEAEFLVEKFKIFGIKGGQTFKEMLEDDEYRKQYIEGCKERFGNSPNKEEMIRRILEHQPRAIELAKTPENIEKRKQTFKEIRHQQGEKNSQYGKMWITDGTKEGSHRINRGGPIPEGFRKGRVSRNEESIKYTYVITTPEGEVIRTKYIDDFCKRNNLVDSIMYRVASGERNSHKGFKVHRELDKPPTNML